MTGPEPAGGRFAGGGAGTPQIVVAGAAGAVAAGVCAHEGRATTPSRPATANARAMNMRMPQILSKRLSLQDFRRIEPADGRAGRDEKRPHQRSKTKGRNVFRPGPCIPAAVCRLLTFRAFCA